MLVLLFRPGVKYFMQPLVRPKLSSKHISPHYVFRQSFRLVTVNLADIISVYFNVPTWGFFFFFFLLLLLHWEHELLCSVSFIPFIFMPFSVLKGNPSVFCGTRIICTDSDCLEWCHSSQVHLCVKTTSLKVLKSEDMELERNELLKTSAAPSSSLLIPVTRINVSQ